jgi:hypothetical protein
MQTIFIVRILESEYSINITWAPQPSPWSFQPFLKRNTLFANKLQNPKTQKPHQINCFLRIHGRNPLTSEDQRQQKKKLIHICSNLYILLCYFLYYSYVQLNSEHLKGVWKLISKLYRFWCSNDFCWSYFSYLLCTFVDPMFFFVCSYSILEMDRVNKVKNHLRGKRGQSATACTRREQEGNAHV